MSGLPECAALVTCAPALWLLVQRQAPARLPTHALCSAHMCGLQNLPARGGDSGGCSPARARRAWASGSGWRRGSWARERGRRPGPVRAWAPHRTAAAWVFQLGPSLPCGLLFNHTQIGAMLQATGSALHGVHAATCCCSVQQSLCRARVPTCTPCASCSCHAPPTPPEQPSGAQCRRPYPTLPYPTLLYPEYMTATAPRQVRHLHHGRHQWPDCR